MKRKDNIDFSSSDPLSVIAFLETSWQGDFTDETKAAFGRLKEVVSSLYTTKKANQRKTKGRPERLSVFDTVKEALLAHDVLFLSRQIRYHVASNPDLPPVYANKDGLNHSISELFKHIAKHSPRGGRISIVASQVSLRGGMGIQLEFHGEDGLLNTDKYNDYVDAIYHSKELPEIGNLVKCRQELLKQDGQLSIEKLQTGRIAYRVILPADAKDLNYKKFDGETYRFDVKISNFSLVRKHYGLNKSKSLVGHVEKFIKSLVRHPIDIVISNPEDGVVSIIYESSLGHQGSVSNRICSRLSKESFRVGKKPVELKFGYNLASMREDG